MELRPIPNVFKRFGYRYTLLQRTDNFVLYEIFGENLKLHKAMVYGYEIHKIRIRQPGTAIFKGKIINYPLREILASDEDFGYYGWAFRTLGKAQDYYDHQLECDFNTPPRSTSNLF